MELTAARSVGSEQVDPNQPRTGIDHPHDSAAAEGSVLLNVAMWMCLVLFTVLSIGTPLIGRGVFLATEMMGEAPPWQAALRDTQAAPNRYVGDTIDSAAPLLIQIVDSVRHGDLPEWSYVGMGGYELGGVPNAGAFSPLSLPWWVLPHSYAPAILKLAEIAAITLGMSLFLRRLGLPQATWPAASLIYAASGFMLAWTNWPQTRVAAFLPLLFWAVERAVGTARLSAAVPVGLVLASMILGGFPAVTIYSGYAAGFYGVLRILQRRDQETRPIVSLWVCTCGVVLGLLFAAWQLLPFTLNNLSVIGGTERSFAGHHLPSASVASMFYPNLAGGIRVGTWLPVHPVEALSYVGIVSLLLVSLIPLGRRIFPGQRGIVIFFGVGTAVLVAAMYYGGVALKTLQAVPTINNSSIGRLNVLVGFFVAVLAAYGLGLLLQGRPAFALWGKSKASRLGGAVRISACILINLAGAWVCYQAFQEVPTANRSRLVFEVRFVTLIAIAAAVSCAVALLTPRRVAKELAVAVVAVGLLLPAVSLARLWWAPSSEESFYAETGTTDFLQRHLDRERYETVGNAFLPGTNGVYSVDSFGGRSFATSQWTELFVAVDPAGRQSATYAWLTDAVAPTSGHNPILDRFGVRYLVQGNAKIPYGSSPANLGVGAGVTPLTGQFVMSEPGQGPIRGFTFEVRADQPVPDVSLSADLVSPDGSVLASTTTWIRSAHGAVPVALSADELPGDQDWRVRLTATSPTGDVPVMVTSDGSLVIGVVAAVDDGMRLVATGDSNVYERLGALDRVHWASTAVVSTDPDERLEMISQGRVPDDAVLLESAGDVRSADAGSTAAIERIDTSDADTQTYRVAATGAGWLRIEDSLRRPGWKAYVDGVEADLVPADYAAGAVYLPGGEHMVQVQFRTPGFRVGTIISLATVALVTAVAVTAKVRRRRETR